MAGFSRRESLVNNQQFPPLLSQIFEENMALVHTDFLLTDEQLRLINEYIDQAASRYAQAGEDLPGGVVIRFGWSPFGRVITAQFDGAVDGFVIES
jgi:hypothetical protein